MGASTSARWKRKDLTEEFKDPYSYYERKDLTEEFKDPYSYYELDETYYNFESFANPCTLHLQCLLFIVGHLDRFPVTRLALLPITLRRELLLLLPAVDVCKLEETKVICDLPMEEIWETLYKSNVDGNHENIVTRPKKDVYQAWTVDQKTSFLKDLVRSISSLIG